MYVYIYIYIYTYIHTYIHTYMCIHIYEYTFLKSRGPSLLSYATYELRSSYPYPFRKELYFYPYPNIDVHIHTHKLGNDVGVWVNISYPTFGNDDHTHTHKLPTVAMSSTSCIGPGHGYECHSPT